MKYSDPSGMQSVYHGVYNPSQPATRGNSVNGPRLIIDGTDYSGFFGIGSVLNNTNGGGGMAIENVEYAGDLTGSRISPGDGVTPKGIVYVGADGWAIRRGVLEGRLHYNSSTGMYGEDYQSAATIKFSSNPDPLVGYTDSYMHYSSGVSFYGSDFVYFKGISGGGYHFNSTEFEGFNQDDVDFAGVVTAGLSTVFGAAAHYSEMVKAGGKIGAVGTVATALSYGNALWTHQAKPSNHLDAAITLGILTFSAIPITAPIAIPFGFIYGGLRLAGGGEFDHWFNNQFSLMPLSTPNKIKP